MIEAHAVSRRYGRTVALEPTDFELVGGEVVALVGPNGAGKSTLLSILARALAPSSGQVEHHAAVGWAPQRAALYPRLTADENLRLFARLERALREPLELPERPVAELSAGQRQLVNLALAFLGSPRAVLLDEPTAALDEGARDELWTRVDRLRADGGAALVATQSSDDAARADRVVRLEDGRVVP